MSTQTFDAAAYKFGQRRDWTEAAAGWRKWWQPLEAALGPVGDRLVELAAIRAGHHVLDIATGIGEPALTAARVVGPAGRVVGTDISPGMLEVARERASELRLGNVEFHEMDAEALDLPESSFDAVLCRFGLMFLPDVDRALVGIRRFLVPGGRFVASVWGPPDRYPVATVAFGAVARVLELPAPAPGTPGMFSLADGDELAGRFRAAGFADVHTETLLVRYEFDSLDEYMRFLQEVAAPINNLLADESPAQVGGVGSSGRGERPVRGGRWQASGFGGEHPRRRTQVRRCVRRRRLLPVRGDVDGVRSFSGHWPPAASSLASLWNEARHRRGGERRRPRRASGPTEGASGDRPHLAHANRRRTR